MAGPLFAGVKAVGNRLSSNESQKFLSCTSVNVRITPVWHDIRKSQNHLLDLMCALLVFVWFTLASVVSAAQSTHVDGVLGLPVLKELPTPCRVVVVPEQAESLFEQVRLVQPFVRLQQ